MNKCTQSGLKCSLFIFMAFLFFSACKERRTPANPVQPKAVDIVEQPEALDVTIGKNIQTSLAFILANKGKLNDTVVLAKDTLVNELYRKRSYQPAWCQQEKWLPASDSLINFISHAAEYGLFPSDYHFKSLNRIRHQTEADTLAQKDAALWSRAELMFSDAFFTLCHHLRKGHLPYDSVTLRKDTMQVRDYLDLFEQIQQFGNVETVLIDLEPKHAGYDSLKTGLKKFLASADTIKRYTFVGFPIRDAKDSIKIFKNLQRRLFEENIVESLTAKMDTTAFKKALSKYQQKKKLKVTGKWDEVTAKSLNNTAWEKFKRIAITLDRYKLLPDTMPTTYIWVNLPSYNMKLIDSDMVVMESRVIVGDPKTRTPLLNSQVTNFITYPQWTVPYSIVINEMLPKIQESTEYLRKSNLIVVDQNDNVLNPDSIKWNRVNKKNFPYIIKQAQGDDNSLGVLKFNFANRYSVYLHDTNARWLFAKEKRALSHGCVRIKDFMKLADFLVRNDSIRFPSDTLRSWITRKEKHVVSGFNKVPIFIRYFTCEWKDGKIRFYDDIYGEDRVLNERYFVNKIL
jgi:murein L,D-transpeptidase YcbB/YkuD